MYESPITINYGDIQTEFKEKTESLIVRCVQNVGVDVNKDELIKVLGYDRDQYDKGYADAKAEIVHCKDCAKHNKQLGDFEILLPDGKTRWIWKDQACPLAEFRGKAQGHEFDYQFCAFGERRTG